MNFGAYMHRTLRVLRQPALLLAAALLGASPLLADEVITSVTIQYATPTPATNQITINGTLFLNGAAPILVLNGTTLAVTSFSKTQIVATFSSSLPAGSYLLTATNSKNKDDFVKFTVTNGAVGPQGPAGIIGATGATGATGQQGPAGLPGSPGSQGPAGPAGLAGFNGIQEFTTPGTYSFTVPNGISHLYVELIGAGGGGGGLGGDGTKELYDAVLSEYFFSLSPGGSGGAGGSGGYTLAIVSVTAGATYTIVVGAAGATGAQGADSYIPGGHVITTGTPGTAGTDGSQTEITDGSGTVLAVATGGGAGGPGGAGSYNAGAPGAAGTAGLGGTGANMIGRNGVPTYLLFWGGGSGQGGYVRLMW